MSRRQEAEADPSVIRSEQELSTGVDDRDAGVVRARKRVETHTVERSADRLVEHADSERTAAIEGDTGEIITYDDGSVSIPVYEEQLVVEKRLVVKERILVRKHTVTEQYEIQADVQRERVQIDADPQVADRVHADGDAST